MDTRKLAVILLMLAGSVCASDSPSARQAGASPPQPRVAASFRDGAAPAIPSPEVVVDAQLVAYNRRDLEGFLAFYADDAVLVDYPDHVTQTGKAAMRERYLKRFANPNVRADIVKRVVFGAFVIDHEQITAPPAAGMIEAVAIYEVKGDKIVRVTFLKK